MLSMGINALTPRELQQYIIKYEPVTIHSGEGLQTCEDFEKILVCPICCNEGASPPACFED